MNNDKVTRFEVIDHTRIAQGKNEAGRVLYHGGKIELSYQDDGKTLKIFLTDGEDK
jgi:hypothetical protein